MSRPSDCNCECATTTTTLPPVIGSCCRIDQFNNPSCQDGVEESYCNSLPDSSFSLENCFDRNCDEVVKYYCCYPQYSDLPILGFGCHRVLRFDCKEVDSSTECNSLDGILSTTSCSIQNSFVWFLEKASCSVVCEPLRTCNPDYYNLIIDVFYNPNANLSEGHTLVGSQSNASATIVAYDNCFGESSITRLYLNHSPLYPEFGSEILINNEYTLQIESIYKVYTNNLDCVNDA